MALALNNQNVRRIGAMGLLAEIVRQSANEMTPEQRSRLVSMAGSLVRQGAEGIRTLPSAFSQLARQIPEHARAIQDAGRNIINAHSDGRLNDDGMRTGERGIVRAAETPLTDLTGGEDMEIEGEETAPEAAMARIGGGGPSAVSKETPISSYPSLSYGLQETHTTILPFTCWFNMTGMSTGTTSKMQFRMNSPYDMILGAVSAGAAANNPISGTVYAWPAGGDGNGAISGFPESINNNLTTESPYWRRYWEQFYEHYTVLGCEWKITCINPVTYDGSSVILAYNYDAYSDTAAASGNVTPDTNLSELMSLKGVNFKVVEEKSATTQGRHVQILQGHYKPGQAKRNIINDGDVRTWTRTRFNDTDPASNGPIPNLKELLNIWCYKAPLSSITSTTVNKGSVNIQLELKYIVQFKDLRGQARYPVTAGGGASVATTISTTRLNTGNPIGVWT